MSKKRTEVADIDRSLYDFTYGEEGFERLDAGLTPDIVTEISQRKDEPQWMLDFRLKSLEIYHKMPNPTWGPGIEGLDMDNIVTYVKPNTEQKNDWESVPDDIKNTFERLGIPEAERSYLAGVGAQYDSELVYHNMQDTASKMGIVYSGIEEALHEPQWEAIIREKFMTLIPPTDHKFAALHGAVWSGGSFVYVPKGVKLDFPLQSYFRLNAKGAGQFEHTLIVVEDDADLHFIEGCSAPKYNVANLHAGAVELFVGKRAHLRYSTIENWSKNMYNLNTKRARCDEYGEIEWISGRHRPEPGYRLQGGPERAGHLRHGRDQVHLQGRRHLHVPQLHRRHPGGRGRHGICLLPVAHARRHLALGHHPGDGHPRQGRQHRPRGNHRPHRRRQDLLPHEPRHLRGGGPHHDRQRLRQPGLQGAAAGVRR